MKRGLLNVAAIVSLVASVITIAVWARSEVAYDCFWELSVDPITHNYSSLALATDNGRFCWVWRSGNSPGATSKAWQHTPTNSYTRSPRGSFDAVQSLAVEQEISMTADGGTGVTNRAIGRIWPLAVATAILPATRLVKRIAALRNKRQGVCSHCGYDLRATPDRCPECGAVPHAL